MGIFLIFIFSWSAWAKPAHEVLGIAPNASLATIRAAYHRLALKHHPDRFPHNRTQAQIRYQEIEKAYRILTQTERVKDREEEAIENWTNEYLKMFEVFKKNSGLRNAFYKVLNYRTEEREKEIEQHRVFFSGGWELQGFQKAILEIIDNEEEYLLGLGVWEVFSLIQNLEKKGIPKPFLLRFVEKTLESQWNDWSESSRLDLLNLAAILSPTLIFEEPEPGFVEWLIGIYEKNAPEMVRTQKQRSALIENYFLRKLSSQVSNFPEIYYRSLIRSSEEALAIFPSAKLFEILKEVYRHAIQDFQTYQKDDAQIQRLQKSLETLKNKIWSQNPIGRIFSFRHKIHCDENFKP